MKICLQLTASSFVSGRIRVVWVPSAHHIPANTSDGAGDYISMVWDFTGDSNLSFTIPYLSDKDFLRVVPYHTVISSTYHQYVSDNLDNCNGMLMLFIMNHVTSSDNNTYAAADINVWAACAEDMMLYGPKPLIGPYTMGGPGLKRKPLKPVAQGQDQKICSMLEHFKQQFDPIVKAKSIMKKGVHMNEEITDLRVLIKRYSKYANFSLPSSDAFYWPYNINFSKGIFDDIASMYQFWRGSFRIKVILKSGSTSQALRSYIMPGPLTRIESDNVGNYADSGDADFDTTSQALSYQDLVQNPVHSVEIPWNCTAAYVPINLTMWSELSDDLDVGYFNITTGAATTAQVDVLFAAGDDMSFGWIQPPPHLMYDPVPALSVKPKAQSLEISHADGVEQITSFEDEQDKLSMTRPIYREPKSSPYDDDDLKSVLERVYTTSVTWTGSQAVDTSLMVYSFPESLISGHANLRDKLSRYQFLRSGAKVSIRANGTKFHSGKCIIMWAPSWNEEIDQTMWSDIYSASQMNHVLLSPNTGEVVEFEIPYVWPRQYINLSHLDSNFPGRIGYFKIMVLNQLKTSVNATVPTITISVNVSLVNPEVAGPTTFEVSSVL